MNALNSAQAFHWVTLFHSAAELVCIHIREKGLTIMSNSSLPDNFITEIVSNLVHEYSVEFTKYGLAGAWSLEHGKCDICFIY